MRQTGNLLHSPKQAQKNRLVISGSNHSIIGVVLAVPLPVHAKTDVCRLYKHFVPLSFCRLLILRPSNLTKVATVLLPSIASIALLVSMLSLGLAPFNSLFC